jgi:hypothetical protein
MRSPSAPHLTAIIHATIGCYSWDWAYVAVESRDALSQGKALNGEKPQLGAAWGVSSCEQGCGSPFSSPRVIPPPDPN